MTDRLADIEAWVAHPTPEPWDRGQVYADLRDLLAVAKAAERYATFKVHGGALRYCRRCHCEPRVCYCPMSVLHAALANLGGAS